MQGQAVDPQNAQAPEEIVSEETSDEPGKHDQVQTTPLLCIKTGEKVVAEKARDEP